MSGLGMSISAQVVRPSRETSFGSWVVAKSATPRCPARCAASNVRAGIGWPATVCMLCPAGSRSTAMAGCSLPSRPKRLRMCVLASEPGVPGVATECERFPLVEETVIAPATASRTQPRTMRRRCCRVRPVIFVMPGKLDADCAPVIGRENPLRLGRESHVLRAVGGDPYSCGGTGAASSRPMFVARWLGTVGTVRAPTRSADGRATPAHAGPEARPEVGFQDRVRRSRPGHWPRGGVTWRSHAREVARALREAPELDVALALAAFVSLLLDPSLSGHGGRVNAAAVVLAGVTALAL